MNRYDKIMAIAFSTMLWSASLVSASSPKVATMKTDFINVELSGSLDEVPLLKLPDEANLLKIPFDETTTVGQIIKMISEKTGSDADQSRLVMISGEKIAQVAYWELFHKLNPQDYRIFVIKDLILMYEKPKSICPICPECRCDIE